MDRHSAKLITDQPSGLQICLIGLQTILIQDRKFVSFKINLFTQVFLLLFLVNVILIFIFVIFALSEKFGHPFLRQKDTTKLLLEKGRISIFELPASVKVKIR